MKEIRIENITDLADIMLNDATEGGFVTAIAKYEDAIDLTKEILCSEETTIECITVEPPEHDGYDKEFFVTLDKNMKLWVEKAWHEANKYLDAGYLMTDADTIYILDYCSSKILDRLDQGHCVAVSIDDDDDDFEPAEHNEFSFVNFIFDTLGSIYGETYTKEDPVLKFINERFPNDSNWVNGNCYYFAKILQERFPDGSIYYDVIDCHFVFKHDGKYYDHTGIVKYDNDKCNNHYLVEWDHFDEYDSIQKKRIIRDCIN